MSHVGSPRIGTLFARRRVLVGACLLLSGCASLGPEGWRPSLAAEGLRRTDLPGGGGVQWDYVLVLRNPNRRVATVTEQALTLAWDGVSRSARAQARHDIPPHGQIRLPQTTVFRREDFQAAASGAPGRPPDAPLHPDTMWIYWQIIGKHEDGGSFLLNYDFFPDRGR
jgi:hypothetical protein